MKKRFLFEELKPVHLPQARLVPVMGLNFLPGFVSAHECYLALFAQILLQTPLWGAVPWCPLGICFCTFGWLKETTAYIAMGREHQGNPDLSSSQLLLSFYQSRCFELCWAQPGSCASSNRRARPGCAGENQASKGTCKPPRAG